MRKREAAWNLTVERGPECLVVKFSGEVVNKTPVPDQ